MRCAPPANKPLPSERDNCLPYAAEELELLRPGVIVCLGAFAWDAACGCYGLGRSRASGTAPSTRTEAGPVLLGTYHPSQQNTFTGKLTEPMLDADLPRARGLAEPLAKVPAS